MRLNIVCFAVGVWLLQRQAELPPMRGAWALLLAPPLLMLARARSSALRIGAQATLATVACAAGFFWAAGMAHVRMADALPHEWEGRDVQVIGVIASLPQVYEQSVRFEFDVEMVATAGARLPSRIVLSWWGRTSSMPQVKAGERWRFTLRLKRPHGTVNPHGFDYEAWLLERGLRATGHVRSHPYGERLAPMVQRPQYWVERIRERLRARILEALPNEPYAGIIVALAVGDQRAIPAHQWQTFTRTGVNHLMSISGLHVTMVSGLAYAFALMLWRRSAALTLRLPARKAAALAGVTAAFVYTLLAGFAVPAQRTLYMVCVVAVALWCGIGSAPSVVLAAALLVVLLIDPWAVSSAGFWLSFGAVAAILMVVVNRVKQPGWLGGWARTQGAVTVALLPLLLALFQQVSLISPVANAFAIPVVSLVVVPLALVGMLLPFDAVLHFAHLVMAWCMHALEWMSATPDAVWQQHAPVEWAIAAGLAGTVWLLLPRGVPARWLGAIACLPLFFVLPPKPRPGEVALAVLDVGQGLSVVVRTANHALVYDTGPAMGPGADSGNRVVAPYLRAVGVRALDGVVLSHDHADHTGGALSVLQALPVAWLSSLLSDMDPLPLIADQAFRCAAGQSWTWDDVRFDVLYPDGIGNQAGGRENERSCVVKVTAPGGSVLLPGDIEKRGEDTMLALGADVSADVIVAPHHGSRTSSTTAFVNAVGAKSVIFPAGYRNRFGHPHPDVVERYRELGASIHRTDRDGAVLISITNERGIAVERWRAAHRRYWLEAP
jgi:competence protein ComEC